MAIPAPNVTLRERFKLHEKHRNQVTNLIGDAVAFGRIKRKDTGSGNKFRRICRTRSGSRAARFIGIFAIKREAAHEYSTGARVKFALASNWLNLAAPPRAEQHRIDAKVDELMALCDQLEVQLTTHPNR